MKIFQQNRLLMGLTVILFLGSMMMGCAKTVDVVEPVAAQPTTVGMTPEEAQQLRGQINDLVGRAEGAAARAETSADRSEAAAKRADAAAQAAAQAADRSEAMAAKSEAAFMQQMRK
jgi:hypothetical protein